MPLYTLADIIPQVARKIDGSGVDPSCASGLERALQEYNKINRIFLSDPELIVTGFVCIRVSSQQITLDHRIKRIRNAKAGAYDNIKVVGQNFMFVDGVAWEQCAGNFCLDRLVNLGSSHPLVQDIDRPRLLYAISNREEAEGASLLVTGADSSGYDLRTDTGKGMTVPITFADCYTSPQFNCGDNKYHRGEVSRIDMIRKPRTKGDVQLWALDEHSGDVRWLVTMGADIVSPSFTRYRVDNPTCRTIFAEVDLQYVPLYDLNDVSLIQSPEAYEDMAMALAKKDANDYASFQIYRNAAYSTVRKNRSAESGNHNKVNIKVSTTSTHGRSYTLR